MAYFFPFFVFSRAHTALLLPERVYACLLEYLGDTILLGSSCAQFFWHAFRKNLDFAPIGLADVLCNRRCIHNIVTYFADALPIILICFLYSQKRRAQSWFSHPLYYIPAAVCLHGTPQLGNKPTCIAWKRNEAIFHLC